MTDLIIEKILEFLSDGEWYNLYEIETGVNAETMKILHTLDFLSEFRIIDVVKDFFGVIIQAKLSKPTIEWYVKVEGG